MMLTWNWGILSSLIATGNIVNFSSVPLSDYQTQLLGLGLNLSLSHQKVYLLDYISQMEKDESDVNPIGNSFTYMNMDSIFRNLCCHLNDVLPRHYRLT